MPEPKWEDLQRAWQDSPSAQLPQLKTLLEKRSRVIWLLTGIDAVGTALLIAGLVWALRHFETTPSKTGWSVFVAAVLVLVWVAVLLIRRGTWRVDVEAPAAMVELSMRRCRASVRLALLNQYALLFLLFVALVVRAAGISAPRLGVEVTFLMQIGAMAFLAGWLIVSEWYKRRKREELERLEALQKEL